MKIALGADANGIALKDALQRHLIDLGHQVTDLTPDGAASGRTDYPDIASAVAVRIADHHFERGLLICGTGLGMAITANKIPGIRAASVADPYSAERARRSNDAQILCLGSQIVGVELAKVLIDHWLGSEFDGGRSTRKVDRIQQIDAAYRSYPVAGL